ncbi:hypothetical protein ABPG73_022928 [Tetrahymena malaccensis]
MSEQSTKQFKIMNNALQLARINYKSSEGQRNLLNKWFQDSVKNYIFEQIASPLIAQNLKCSSSSEVKSFIHKNIDKSKPKYMSIIDQYFFYINKFNKSEDFVQKLNDILFNPLDITQESSDLNIPIQRAIRKQLVCYLILRFFETYGQFEVPSFYELWNLCFPEELQKKKRLTRFDKKNTNSTQKITIKNESSSNYEYSIQSSSDLSNINQIPYLNQESSQNLQASIIIDSNNICSLDQSQINIQEPASENQQVAFSNQKKQINNGIIEEDDSDDEETSVFSYTPKVNFSQPFQPTQQPYSNKNDRYLNIEKIQISEQYQYLSLQSDQNQFFYQNEHYEQLFDNYELNQYQLIQNQTNYQINQDSYDFPLYQNYY